MKKNASHQGALNDFFPFFYTFSTLPMLSLTQRLSGSLKLLDGASSLKVKARITAVQGQGIDIVGLSGLVGVGASINLHATHGQRIIAEIVGFSSGVCRAVAYHSVSGLSPGSCAVTALPPFPSGLAVHTSWLGRVIDPLGRPLDRCGPLIAGPEILPRYREAPPSTTRARLGPRIDLGVAAINLFATCRRGQRLGLFAGPGVGKSTLLGMLASNTKCDVVVIALIGERGREVREFLEDELKQSGLARAVVIVATSDMSSQMRRESAVSAMTIAEYFRNIGKDVLLIMDSITRYCLALREIGLAAGELPVSRGYPASVFSELPRLLERAGPGPESDKTVGYITGLFSVLIEGDDINEPLADSIRGILDGHIVLDRKIAEGGRYPAIDVLRSLSRTVPGCNTNLENDIVSRARGIISIYEDMHELIRLGAYRPGTDGTVDRAIELAPKIGKLLHQGKGIPIGIQEEFITLHGIIKNNQDEK